MAKDSGPENKTKAQDVDLDELEVVILILGKNATSLSQAASFLTRRGWPTTVMTNMSKAVEHIAETKPDFILVSFNHPNPAVMKLPDLIVQTFNLSCIGFVENQDSGSLQRLANFKMRYKIQGMPSGPNLQRSIRKILAEKFNIKTDEDKRHDASRDRADRESNTVTVKGGAKEGAAQSGSNMVKGDGGVEAAGAAGSTGRKRLTDIAAAGSGSGGEGSVGYMPDHSGGEETHDPLVTEGNDSVSTGKYTMSKGNRKSLKELTAEDFAPDSHADSLQNKDSSGGKPKQGNLAEMLKKSLFGENGQDTTDQDLEHSVAGDLKSSATQSGRDSVAGKNSPGSSTPGGGSVSALEAAAQKAAQSSAEAAAAKAAAKAGASAASHADVQKQSAANSSRHGKTPESSKAGLSDVASNGEVAQAAGPLRGTSVQLADLSPEQIAALPPAQLLERAVAAAMLRICQRTPEGPTRTLGALTKVAVFPVDSVQFPGYLVVGMEDDPARIEDFFLKTCETALREEFANVKVPAVIENGFWVHVPEVAFHAWTAQRGNFKMVLPHEEAEVGIGFFPLVGALPKAEVYSENKEMLKIAIDDISTEQPINFKAYLHLKKNQKYFLYLRNGRVLQPEQKNRLKGNQVQSIFMKTVEAENLRMFLAASYLRDTMKKTA